MRLTTRIRPAARWWIAGIILHLVTWGGFALYDPSLYQSTAYDTIRVIAPIRVWGAVFLAVASVLLFVLVARENHVGLAKAMLYVHFGLMMTVAWSITWLSFNGASGALGGAFTWALLGAGSLAIQRERIGIRSLESA